MIKIRKGNVVLRVSEEEVKNYLKDGYLEVVKPEPAKKVAIAPKVKDALEKEVTSKTKGKK